MTLVAQDVADVSYKDDNNDIDIAEEAPDNECYFEESRVVADEDDDEAEERSLWGDGDNDPADADA